MRERGDRRERGRERERERERERGEERERGDGTRERLGNSSLGNQQTQLLGFIDTKRKSCARKISLSLLVI